MLRDDDVERIVEIGDEFGVALTEKDAHTIWTAYTNKMGNSNIDVPFGFDELTNIVLTTAKELGMCER